MFRLVLSICALFFSASPVIAATPVDCDRILEFAERGEPIPPTALNAVREPLACIVPQISSYFDVASDTKTTFNDFKVRSYLSLTSAAILLVELEGPPKRYPKVDVFRSLDNVDVARTLAAGARHPERPIRINSARLLANVIDNSTFCVALDFLHAPVEDRITNHYTVIGRANLLGAVKPHATWIGSENQLALRETIATIEASLQSYLVERPQDYTTTSRLISEINANLVNNNTGNVAPNLLASCQTDYAYLHWRNDNPYKAALGQVETEPEVVPAPPADPQPAPAIQPVSLIGNQRICYQEYRSDSGADSFLVACHKTKDLCEKAKQNPKTKSSACVELDMDTLNWEPASGGLWGSLFLYQDTQFPPPFPPLVP